MKFEIPEPCQERWEAMEQRPEGRFCDRCQHTVLDLSRLTRRDAERRVKKETRDYVCVQLAVENDEAVFRPDPKRAAGWAGGLVLAAALTAGCSGRPRAETHTVAVVATNEPAQLPMIPRPAEPVPMASEVIIPVSEGAEPTAEQRELTRRKHAAQVPQIQMIRGRMPLRDF